MTSTITLLVDNQAQPGLKQEHGLSLLIEHQGKRILFDNGQHDALFYNAARLNIPLNNLDVLILSHGHYDHGGNLAALLQANPHALFYAHPDCTQTRYSLHPDKAPRTISLTDDTLTALDKFPAQQKKFITATTQIMTGVWLTGQIPRISPVEDTGGPFFLDKEKKQKDQLYDDMSLYIAGETGLTVICGCCHSGIINTLTHIKKQMQQPLQISNLIGGLHLVNANQQRISTSIDYLNKQNIANIYPCHCTGDNAMQSLSKQFKNNLQIAQAGLKITLR